MIVGRVLDSIWCTRKEDELTGLKFLKVKLLNRENANENAEVVVATDLIGAGIGELVLLTKGSSARRLPGLEHAPIDCIIIGIIDANTENEENADE